MNRVYTAKQRSFEDIRHLAIALKAISPNQRHIGILHQSLEAKQVLMLHLAWHHDLRNDSPSEKYVWVDPAIPQARAKQVAAFCRKVWRQNKGKIPYAFSPPNDCFDLTTGEFLLGGQRFGLTCATFVMAVFQATGLPLIDLNSWPSRPEDVAWQSQIIELLKKTDAELTHINRAQQEIGSARFRPEEVGAAAACQPWPTSIEHVLPIAEQIVNLLNMPPN